MTAGARYDVVYIADSSGEFGRYVSYETSLPRPSVGTAGLVATAWSWSWDRDAAVQLQHRYEKISPPRRMNGADLAGVGSRQGGDASGHADALDRFRRGQGVPIERQAHSLLVKGQSRLISHLDHQLRAPALLSTADAVIERGSVAAVFASDQCARHARHRRAGDGLSVLSV